MHGRATVRSRGPLEEENIEMKKRRIDIEHREAHPIPLCSEHIVLQMTDAKFAIEVMYEVCRSRIEPSHPNHRLNPNWQELSAMLKEYLRRYQSIGPAGIPRGDQ